HLLHSLRRKRAHLGGDHKDTIGGQQRALARRQDDDGGRLVLAQSRNLLSWRRGGLAAARRIRLPQCLHLVARREHALYHVRSMEAAAEGAGGEEVGAATRSAIELPADEVFRSSAGGIVATWREGDPARRGLGGDEDGQELLQP